MKFVINTSKEVISHGIIYTCSLMEEIDGLEFDDFDILINNKYQEAIEFMDNKYEDGHWFKMQELESLLNLEKKL